MNAFNYNLLSAKDRYKASPYKCKVYKASLGRGLETKEHIIALSLEISLEKENTETMLAFTEEEARKLYDLLSESLQAINVFRNIVDSEPEPN